VDEEALIAALRGGKIAAAAIDTFRKEPPDDLRRLCEAGKVVLTPHIAASTVEAQARMALEAVRNTLAVLEGREPNRNYMVNPEIMESE